MKWDDLTNITNRKYIFRSKIYTTLSWKSEKAAEQIHLNTSTSMHGLFGIAQCLHKITSFTNHAVTFEQRDGNIV